MHHFGPKNYIALLACQICRHRLWNFVGWLPPYLTCMDAARNLRNQYNIWVLKPEPFLRSQNERKFLYVTKADRITLAKHIRISTTKEALNQTTKDTSNIHDKQWLKTSDYFRGAAERAIALSMHKLKSECQWKPHIQGSIRKPRNKKGHMKFAQVIRRSKQFCLWI